MRERLARYRYGVFGLMLLTGILATTSMKAADDCWACDSHWLDPDEWCTPRGQSDSTQGQRQCFDKNQEYSTCSLKGEVCYEVT